jgi:putative methyltransferase (TIGR04325 family)
MADPVIPVVLFAYARPAHLARALACLRENGVPLIYAFADGAKGEADAAAVAETRALLRAVDWCEMRLTERGENFGLGRNVLAGVSDVAARHEAFVVWEDDLVSVSGTYAWVCAALRRYAADERVMSVSAWTHPRVTPADVGAAPYSDARAECWVWGAWARSWRGMAEQTALEKMAAAAKRGVAADAYGADLPEMARGEAKKNIWAVRWLYHHFQHGGLCVRPPWSMVEHIGFDAGATNAAEAVEWENPPLRAAPPVPVVWPEPREAEGVRGRWQAANPPRPPRIVRGVRRLAKAAAKALLPEGVRATVRAGVGWKWFEGNFATWAEAAAASGGYDDAAIVERALRATRAVRDGRGAFERDGVVFAQAEPEPGLVDALRQAATACGGRLRVVDFGGALGTTYWRHRGDFSGMEGWRWDVVEQAKFVAAGRAELGGATLRFFASVEEAGAAGGHDLLLASTVVQYLESPEMAVEAWMARGARFILLNNLPLHARAPDRIAVQRVPPEIYAASYPVRFFNRERFLARFDGRYDVVSEFPGEAIWPVGWRRYRSTGFLLRRKE